MWQRNSADFYSSLPLAWPLLPTTLPKVIQKLITDRLLKKTTIKIILKLRHLAGDLSNSVKKGTYVLTQGVQWASAQKICSAALRSSTFERQLFVSTPTLASNRVESRASIKQVIPESLRIAYTPWRLFGCWMRACFHFSFSLNMWHQIPVHRLLICHIFNIPSKKWESN